MSHYKAENDFEQYMHGMSGFVVSRCSPNSRVFANQTTSMLPPPDIKNPAGRMASVDYLLSAMPSTPSMHAIVPTRVNGDANGHATIDDDRTITTAITAPGSHEKA